VLFNSLGTFAGATSNSNTNGDQYIAKRTEAGWQIDAIDDAPLTQFGYATPGEPVVSESGAALLALHTISEPIWASVLYRRDPGGSRTLVGRLVPITAYPSAPAGVTSPESGVEDVLEGASTNLTHVVFSLAARVQSYFPPSITTALWPGDATVVESGLGYNSRSLYQYKGAGEPRPELIPVDNSGQLLGQCGSVLGGITGNHVNAVSSDGRTVFFTVRPQCPGTPERTPASPPGAGPPVNEVFARTSGTTTTAISEPRPNPGCATAQCLAAPLASANYEGASADGTKVLFTSTQQLLDNASEDSSPEDDATHGCTNTTGPNGCNLYEYELGSGGGGRTLLVSGGDTSGLGPGVQGVAATSDDGSHVYFVAKGVLTSTPNRSLAVGQQLPAAGADNLYLYERDTAYPNGHTSFIATLAPGDHSQWSEEPMNATADGRYLVFTSFAALTPGDNSTSSQVFRYDATQGEVVRVSIGDEGFNQNGNTSSNSAFVPTPQRYGPVSIMSLSAKHPAVTNTGIVVFTSSDGLTPRSINDPTDTIFNVYEYENGRVFLISDGRDQVKPASSTGGAAALGISETGTDVWFTTNSALVAQDGNTATDIYDARSNGGFPSGAALPACSEEGCQPASEAYPGGATPGSATFNGVGNVPPPVITPAKAKSPAQIRAQKLAKALKACKAKHAKHKRERCERQARKRYGLLHHSNSKSPSRKEGK
jgi:hypothetical protein